MKESAGESKREPERILPVTRVQNNLVIPSYKIIF